MHTTDKIKEPSRSDCLFFSLWEWEFTNLLLGVFPYEDYRR